MTFSDGVSLLINGIVASTPYVTVGWASRNGREATRNGTEGCSLRYGGLLFTVERAARSGREGCS
jgi:hypothetical protein